MRTVYYKSKKQFLNSEPWDLHSEYNEVAAMIRKKYKEKHKLASIKDDELVNYDINFLDESINAKVLIDLKVEETLRENKAKKEYYLDKFSFEIKKAEINDDAELEALKQQEDFMDFVTHPASNMKPDHYYFHVNIICDVEFHDGLYMLRQVTTPLKDTVLKGLYRSLVFFPRTEENLAAFKKAFKNVTHRELTDNILVEPDSIPLDKCFIETVLSKSENHRSKVIDAIKIENGGFAGYIDMSDFYEKEVESYIEEARIRREEKAQRIQAELDSKKEKIDNFLNKMIEIQKYTAQLHDGSLDYENFPMDLIKLK